MYNVIFKMLSYVVEMVLNNFPWTQFVKFMVLSEINLIIEL
jgi:hypothetical protein